MIGLAENDFYTIIYNDGGIPSENQINSYHYDEYMRLNIPVTAFGGAAYAALTMDWSFGAMHAYEIDDDLTKNKFYKNMTLEQISFAIDNVLASGYGAIVETGAWIDGISMVPYAVELHGAYNVKLFMNLFNETGSKDIYNTSAVYKPDLDIKNMPSSGSVWSDGAFWSNETVWGAASGSSERLIEWYPTGTAQDYYSLSASSSWNYRDNSIPESLYFYSSSFSLADTLSYIYADDLSNVDWNYGYSYASSYGVEPSYAAYLNNDSFESGADFGGLGVNFYSQGVSVGFTFQFPIVLDLNGDGISITQRDTSTVWRDVNGDGTAHRTSWAAAGDGVLVYDRTGTGDVDAPEAYQFTLWDPTADSDMEALANVFDTNGNGALDAGDAQWSSFKVLVTNADGTTTLKTLAALGITAIDLEPDNTMAVLPDGTQVLGSTTFTRANGTTGTAADVVLTADADGYLVQSTTTANADGTTSIRVKAYDTDGSFVKETLTTTSPNGHTRVRHSRAPSSTSVRMRKSSVNWPDTKSSDQRAAEAERGLKRLYEAIEAGDRPEHPALKERVVALRALRDQAQVDFERAQASLESSGSMALTPAVLPKFATTARRRLRQEGGGHRRDHLRAFAPRVEVGERHVRVITSQAELLRALTSASRGKSAYPETV
ncbi:hypothetical protein [Xanthobacter sp. ZOL 2024]